MPISEETYERVALEDPEGQWELVCGRLREKPIMTTEHNRVLARLDRRLVPQLDEEEYRISVNSSRLRISTGSFYVPDLCVITHAAEQALLATPGRFEVYVDPVPLVAEVWSPSTGAYDIEQKLREYQWRKDLEIWRLHPYEKTLTVWRRQTDGTYSQSVHRNGPLPLFALPGVAIEIGQLFA